MENIMDNNGFSGGLKPLAVDMRTTGFKGALDTVFAAETARPQAPAGNIAFTGKAGEYFRIWIVNLLLTVLTLGIYSAWASVRRKQYFYGNTLLQGSAFAYLGKPLAILKGRAIAVAVLAAVYGLSQLLQFDLFSIVFMLALPYVFVKAVGFNTVNSAYRNMRFGFDIGDGEFKKVFKSLILPALLVPLTLGIMYPHFVYKRRQLVVQSSAYGSTHFAFDGTTVLYRNNIYDVWFMFLLFVIGSVVTMGIGALPLYVLYTSYRDVKIGQLNWNHVSLGEMRLQCSWKKWELFRLRFVNALAIIFTLGLMTPWATIRSLRYQLQGLSIVNADGLDAFAGAAVGEVAALGQEAGELMGFDIGI